MARIVKLRFLQWREPRYNAVMLKERLELVEEAYSGIARAPEQRHPFPVGRELAEGLGYPGSLLDRMPSQCVEAFAGVSNVSLFADIRPGDTVLDLGCGAGLDLLVAAERGAGKLIGVDFSVPMLDRAQLAVESAAQQHRITLVHGSAQRTPLVSASVDVAMVNGLFNLNPDRSSVFRELFRLLRPGGSVFAAELVLNEPLPREMLDNANWLA